MSTKLNINEHVRVKLTEHGREIMRQNHKEFMKTLRRAGYDGEPIPLSDKKEDPEGYSQWALWELMREFGEHMHAGAELPFETEILLKTWS